MDVTRAGVGDCDLAEVFPSGLGVRAAPGQD